MLKRWVLRIVAMALAVIGQAGLSRAADLAEKEAFKKFARSYCTECHNEVDGKERLDLEKLLTSDVSTNAEAWEKVVRKLSARQMPPKDAPRPSEQEYTAALAFLASSLDSAAAKSPNPGRTETFRRLNRTEYQNVIRDLLGVEIDSATLLPPDELSHGFDNVTVADLSPTLLNRYISASRKISRLAIGGASSSPRGDTFRIRPDVTQDVHIEGLPIGTRGGALIPYQFPVDGEYEIQVHLMRDRNEDVEGLREPHEMEMLIDKERVAQFTVKPPANGQSNQSIDANLSKRIKVKAGPHQVGVTFVKNSSPLLETHRQPLNVHFNYYRHPRIGPAVYEVSILGPYESSGPGDTPSRRLIFTSRPKDKSEEEACAKQIVANLARRLYRRPVSDEDLKTPLEFYKNGHAEKGLEHGIEMSLTALLVQPQFLFRIERDPPELTPSTAYRISDLELASRLSFFLWSSAPDDELLELATQGELSNPKTLEKQVRRMLADERARSLATNFAGQWLYLRNLESVSPDMRLFPDFDDNLRQALRRETELFVESVFRKDRSALDLLKADYTFLNERLAKHYGIPGVYGSHFRRVQVNDELHRGGLLRQGSILTVTSYATRTSPVIRGHWVLQNLAGSAPPPPPPDVPTLMDNQVFRPLSMRERLAEHRTNAACAVCHVQMDPVGFSLENFDALGRWRKTDAGQPIDSSGGFIDGSDFSGAAGLEKALLDRPELFVRTLTEKLLTFGLGRGVEYYDAPAVRKIVRDARSKDFRFSELILGVVKSQPFQMRMTSP